MKSGTPIETIKVDLTTTAIKSHSASWIILAWQEVQESPYITINGFKSLEFLMMFDFKYYLNDIFYFEFVVHVLYIINKIKGNMVSDCCS